MVGALERAMGLGAHVKLPESSNSCEETWRRQMGIGEEHNGGETIELNTASTLNVQRVRL